MKHGVAYFLLKLKKEDSKYYKKLLWLDSWYHQFQHHINITYVNSAFLVFMVSFFMIGLLDSIPFEEEHLAETCVCCGKKATKMVFWGKAY